MASLSTNLFLHALSTGQRVNLFLGLHEGGLVFVLLVRAAKDGLGGLHGLESLFLESLIEDYEYLNVHFEIEHDQALRELHANYTKAKNLTQIEMENLCGIARNYDKQLFLV